MLLDKTIRVFYLLTRPLSTFLNYIAAGVLAAMMFLTGLDVTFRYLFNSPIPGSYEITQYMMPIVIAFGLARCAMEKGHVNVELVISRFSARTKACMNSIVNLFFFALFALITWQSLLRAMGMITSGLKSEVLAIPVFPFVLMVTLGCGVLSLVALKDVFEFLAEALRSWHHSP
jgi:TRAP-type C4-dicarboxylate transport system permease small subunit